MANSSGGLTRRIKWKQLQEFEFLLPPMSVQRSISRRLWAAYNLKERYKTLYDQTDEYVKSQFIEMLSNSGYEEKSLGELCDKITDGSHNPPKGNDGSEYLMISSKNVFIDGLDLADVRYLSKEEFDLENKRTEVKKNNILLTIVGTIGRTYLVKGNEGNIVMQRSVAVLKPSDRVNPLFMMYSLHIDENLEKEGRGNAQKGVYLKQLSQFKIKVPSLDVQNNFCTIYQQADKSKFSGLKSQFIEMFERNKYPRLSLDAISKEWAKGQGFKKDDICEDGETQCIHYGELFTKYGPIINEVVSKTSVEKKKTGSPAKFRV